MIIIIGVAAIVVSVVFVAIAIVAIVMDKVTSTRP